MFRLHRIFHHVPEGVVKVCFGTVFVFLLPSFVLSQLEEIVRLFPCHSLGLGNSILALHLFTDHRFDSLFDLKFFLLKFIEFVIVRPIFLAIRLAPKAWFRAFLLVIAYSKRLAADEDARPTK